MSIGESPPPLADGFSDFEVIGQGGFSTVYSAIQTDFRRRVAIKVLNVDPSSVSRLRRETFALGALDGIPNVVQAHQMLTLGDGRFALVMRLMTSSLATRISATGPLPVDQVLTWARQIGAALESAHHRGIFHRDIKPGNVLLSSDDEAFVADFGIATLADLDAHTATALSLSPLFAPPERFEGVAEDPQLGDIYALAATLYCALSGTPPFGTTADGGIYGLTQRVMSGQLPTSPAVPGALHVVLARAMSTVPTNRHPTVRALVDDLVAAGTLEHTVPRVSPSPVPGLLATDAPVPPPDAVAPMTPPPYVPESPAPGPSPTVDDATVMKPRRVSAGAEPPPAKGPVAGPPDSSPPDPGASPSSKRNVMMVMALALVAAGVVLAIIVGSGDDTSVATDPTDEPSATEPPSTDPPGTDPPNTDPPATDPPVTNPPSNSQAVAKMLAMTPEAQIDVLRSRFPQLSDCTEAPTTDGFAYQPRLICQRELNGQAYSLFAWAPDPGTGQAFVETGTTWPFPGGVQYQYLVEDQLYSAFWQYDGEPYFLHIVMAGDPSSLNSIVDPNIELLRPD